jgi:LacI family transcriptional regulator
MATIYDVAELAGVSPKTVSRVLNDEPYVRDKLRRRVLQAMEELEYRPKFSARQMRTQKSEAIALITDEIAITPYAVGIIHGAFKEAWNHHKLLLIVNSERDAEIEKDFIKMMLERQVEGIIYATMAHRQAVLPQALQEIPTVLVNCFDADRSLFSVVPDEVQGGYTATKLLLTKGHRRVGFINDPDENPGAGGRLQGYKKALQEFAIPFDPDLYAQAAALWGIDFWL